MRTLIAITTLVLLLSVSPARAQSALGPGFYDHTVPAILYPDWTWATTVDSTNYGGSRYTSAATTTTNIKIKFNIWGDGFTLYVVKSPGGGQMSVSINNVIIGDISWYASSLTYGTITITGLGWGDDGVHEVLLQKSNAANQGVNLDALHVLHHVQFPTAIVPTYPPINVTVVYPTPATQTVNIGNWSEATLEVETTEDPTRSSWDVDGQTVAMVYQVDTGQIFMTIIQVIIMFILLIMMVFYLRGKQAQ